MNEMDHQSYPLFVREGTSRVFLKLKDEGLELEPQGLVWWIKGEMRQRSYADIATVTLAVQGVAKVGMMGTCQILFRDGMQLQILSSTAHGMADDERAKFYATFVHDLHARLAPLAEKITFRAGFGGGRRNILAAALIAGALFFIGVPLAILLVANDTRGLKFAAIGAVLLYFPFKTWKANKPRSYDPAAVPTDLLP